MERRVLVAIFLSFGVLWAYQALVVKPTQKPAVTATSTAGTSTATMPSPAEPAPGAAEAPAPAAAATTPASTPLVGDPSERDVRVETQDVIAIFTNRGARLKSLRLKHYLDQTKAPQELVASETSPAHPLPFSLRTTDAAQTKSINDALFSVSGAPSEPLTTTSADLTFEYRDSSGLHVAKQFHLDPTSYIITFADQVTVGDNAVPATIDWGPAVGDVGENSRYIKKAEGLLFENGKVQRLAPKDIAKQATYRGSFHYAGVDDNYFMTAALFAEQSTVSFQAVSIPPRQGSSDPPRDLVAFSIQPDGRKPLKFFAGPKDFDVLASIDRDVTRAIDFGMFGFLVVPLLRSLKWVNGYVGNYGWSIIILTVLINAIMFPLRHKSVVSMRKMQEIQPEAKAIQDRYAKYKATDPAKQKMNQELMALYKERGVNPASGCVPMLLTMPVLFAMWALLQTSIELRGAPWFGWIHDLSAHDPLYITPVLMGASQFWQQRMQPAPGADPAQQKMMMFMPVMFTFMFLWAPAGLAIYYGVSNMWGIGQQYLTNYLIGPPKIRNVRPPAERRIKRAGGA
jgi:YidC/Oxa1 family membrane protein insertase